MVKTAKDEERWYVSARFSEMDVAENYRIPPHIWDEMPENSKAEMIARARVKAQMQRWDEYRAEKRRETKNL